MRSLMPWRHTGGNLLEPFRREMEDVFERFFEPMEGNGPRALQTWAPRVDIEESDKEIVVRADVPGVDAKDVEVSLVEGSLILRGEKKEEKKEEGKDYHRVERFMGQFFRAIPLPAGADASKIAATSSKGVVTITIPKKPEVQPKKIAVVSKD
jgi:HSP20 family protein